MKQVVIFNKIAKLHSPLCWHSWSCSEFYFFSLFQEELTNKYDIPLIIPKMYLLKENIRQEFELFGFFYH
jgi:hypothetical protein